MTQLSRRDFARYLARYVALSGTTVGRYMNTGV